MSTSDLMALKEEAIRGQYGAALQLLSGFDHAPRLGKAKAEAAAPERSPGIGTRPRFRSTVPGMATQSAQSRAGSVRLIDRIEALSDGILSPEQAGALNALRRALAVALALGETLSAASELAELKRSNLEGRLSEPKRAQFGTLLQAEALAVLFTFANSLSYLIAPHLGNGSLEIDEVDEVLSDNAPLALQGALWELDQDIQSFAQDDAQLVLVLAAFAESLMAKVKLRADALPAALQFAQGAWKVEADGLVLEGFKPARNTKSAALTMAFKKPHEVVGNHIAKYQSLRLAKMLMAYDFERKLNPFAELGGFIFTFMGDGKPGTGKTTLIQMMAGLLNDYCQIAGYPFRYQNFSIDQIDSYQGKSGQNAKAFIDAVLDPAVIGFGTIDDIDQVAGKRGDRQSSAGQQEVTAVFMQAFAGASTVVRGNATFGMFSNYPENVDDALRQRAGARFLVDGPQTREDYIDILALLLGKRHDIPLGDHDLFAAQEIQRAVGASFAGHNQPHEPGLLAVWERAQQDFGPLDNIAKIGSYLKAIQQADPRFTGRAIKNITDAVKVRAMDFELPDLWMEEPEQFLFKDYDTKLAMIRDLMTPITAEMVMQEVNRYADSEFRYAGSSDQAAIANMVRDLDRQDQARRLWLASKEGAGKERGEG